MTMNPIQRICDVENVVIANGSALSAALPLNGRILTGVYMPAAWTAAGLTFQGSHDGVAFSDIYSATAEVSAAAVASAYVALDPRLFFGCSFIKVRSGTTAVPVNQGGARTLSVSAGKYDAT